MLAALGMSLAGVAQLGLAPTVIDPGNVRESVFPWMLVSTVAQLGPVSLGLELAPHSSDVLSPYQLGIGASIGYNQELGDKLDLTLYASYISLGRDVHVGADFPKCSLVPIHFGGKYYLSERGSGIYTHLQGGIHNLRVTTPDIGLTSGTTSSESYLSAALGVGYVLNKKIDVGVRYNYIAPDSDVQGATASNYLGFRLAYTLIGAGE